MVNKDLWSSFYGKIYPPRSAAELQLAETKHPLLDSEISNDGIRKSILK